MLLLCEPESATEVEAPTQSPAVAETTLSTVSSDPGLSNTQMLVPSNYNTPYGVGGSTYGTAYSSGLGMGGYTGSMGYGMGGIGIGMGGMGMEGAHMGFGNKMMQGSHSIMNSMQQR